MKLKLVKILEWLFEYLDWHLSETAGFFLTQDDYKRYKAVKEFADEHSGPYFKVKCEFCKEFQKFGCNIKLIYTLEDQTLLSTWTNAEFFIFRRVKHYITPNGIIPETQDTEYSKLVKRRNMIESLL